MVQGEEGMKFVPQLYAVPPEHVDEEYKNPGCVERIALGRCPLLWAQSLYILGRLLQHVSFFFLYFHFLL
jgi:Glycosyl hydrolases family 15.